MGFIPRKQWVKLPKIERIGILERKCRSRNITFVPYEEDYDIKYHYRYLLGRWQNRDIIRPTKNRHFQLMDGA